MAPGDVVLTSLNQADGAAKLRPALLLCRLPGFGDWLVCGISTQTRHQIAGFDELIVPTDVDYAASGIRAESLVRLGFLGTLAGKQIAGSAWFGGSGAFAAPAREPGPALAGRGMTKGG